jgi:hypothetical protein
VAMSSCGQLFHSCDKLVTAACSVEHYYCSASASVAHKYASKHTAARTLP